jgi:BirA family transcriptional regulator, biotin operon repressor / biotin---[acetyl-CoA-carboxylase] ligase
MGRTLLLFAVAWYAAGRKESVIESYALTDVFSPFGAPVYRVAETASTMDDARAFVLAGAPHGTAIVADCQSRGRGRVPGRSWLSDRGEGLLLTVVLNEEAFTARPISLAVGLAVARAVDRYLASAEGAGSGRGMTRLKWPNDVMLGGAKAGGILCEQSGGIALAGIGLNCGLCPPELRGRATSLGNERGGAAEPWKVLPYVLDELLATSVESGVVKAVSERLFGLGDSVTFLEGDPARPRAVRGRISGIDGNGALLLTPEDGGPPTAFYSGEIRY